MLKQTTGAGRLNKRRGCVAATAGLGLLAFLAGGCSVPQDRYDALFETNRALEARVADLTEQLNGCQRDKADLTARVNQGSMIGANANATTQQLRDELARTQARIAELESQLRGIQFGPLDSATDAALAELAAKYPDILIYDAERGMLRFASDVTFASGSFEITAAARQTIAELGRILLSTPTAAQYDIRVVGHTDGQRVSARPGRKFDNNDELSAFRAITVRRELVNAGLGADRCEFAGFGEARPLVPNTGNGNVQQNRRVEVYLVRSTMGAARAAAAPARPATPPARPSAPATDMMK
jgi:chemotaxis protein MotB